MRKPCFDEFLKVLRKERPSRPTLFEFFLNGPLNEKLAEFKPNPEISGDYGRLVTKAYEAAGYDYVTTHGSRFNFPTGEHAGGASYSMDEGILITDRESFEKYPWPNPDDFDYSELETCKEYLPDGMKVIVYGPCGVLENVIKLVGYEGLCYLIADDEDLVHDIFEAVGSRLVRYYELCSVYDAVGAMISNDDWGFNTQTMLAPDDMRKFVIPWHKKIADTIHASGRPAILHSCGQLRSVMDDIIDYIKYDAKHSYEDNIECVEEAYEEYGSRIAILGGLDLDFVCRKTPEEVYNRAKAMLERSKEKGGYALGTGNSIPEYVPHENYFAMIKAATEVDTW